MKFPALSMLLSLGSLLRPSESANVLIVGDSMGEFSTNVLETFCSGSTVKNAALGGTTAAQWATYNEDVVAGCGGSYDYVWISLGGNDLLGSPGCGMSASELQSLVSSAITNIKTNIAPGATKYLTTCYCQPQGPEEGSACNTPQLVSKLCDGIKAASDADPDVEYVPSLDACGGSSTQFSNPGYFEDQIHLNKRGYCKFFTRPAIQSLLQVSGAEKDKDKDKDRGQCQSERRPPR